MMNLYESYVICRGRSRCRDMKETDEINVVNLNRERKRLLL